MAKLQFTSIEREPEISKEFTIEDPGLPNAKLQIRLHLPDIAEQIAIDSLYGTLKAKYIDGYWRDELGNFQTHPLPWAHVGDRPVVISTGLLYMACQVQFMCGELDHEDVINMVAAAPAAFMQLENALDKIKKSKQGGPKPGEDSPGGSAI